MMIQFWNGSVSRISNRSNKSPYVWFVQYYSTIIYIFDVQFSIIEGSVYMIKYDWEPKKKKNSYKQCVQKEYRTRSKDSLSIGCEWQSIFVINRIENERYRNQFNGAFLMYALFPFSCHIANKIDVFSYECDCFAILFFFSPLLSLWDIWHSLFDVYID